MGTLWVSRAPEPAAAPATVRSKVTEFVTRLTHRPATADLPEQPAPAYAFDAARLTVEEGVSRPDDIVAALLELYIPGNVRPDVRAKLVSFLAAGHPAGPDLARRVREAVHAILSTAEYQLA
jgi:hypothetical protein